MADFNWRKKLPLLFSFVSLRPVGVAVFLFLLFTHKDTKKTRHLQLFLRYTFPTIPLTDTPVNSYMVSYYPGEAEGSPDSDMIDEGTEITLIGCMFTAPEGKQFKAWAIGSANGEQKQPGEKITISEETYIIAIWKDVPITNYTITATAGANGTISPSGEVTVPEATNQTFTITANSGYHIKDVKVNGSSVGAVSSYTFENVSANAIITVEFEVNTVSHVCNPTIVPKDEPECTTAGKNAYYHCECGKNYEDAQGNTEITNIETWGILSPLDHNPSVTWSTDGEYHWKECTRCAGQQLEKSAHEDGDNDGKCDLCGYVKIEIGSEEETTENETVENESNEQETGESESYDEESSEAEATEDESVESESDTDITVSVSGEGKNKGLGAGAIIGIAVGAVAVGGIGGFALFWFVIKKKSFADLIAVFKK